MERGKINAYRACKPSIVNYPQGVAGFKMKEPIEVVSVTLEYPQDACMAAQFNVAMITELMHNRRIALYLMYNGVPNILRMSRRTKVSTRWWLREKG